MLRAVIFDLDDTLFPEYTYVVSGFRAVAGWAEEALGVPRTEAEGDFQQLFDQGVRGRVFDSWLQARGLDPEQFLAGMIEVYRCHEPVIRPHRGAVAILRRLRSKYRLGLLSDGDANVQGRKLRALRLGLMFDDVLFTDELGRNAWKPSPQSFLLMQRRLGIRGNEGVYVGDNPEKDFLGAHRAGMLGVRLRMAGGIYSRAEPRTRDHAPDHEIRGLRLLEQTLSRIANGSSAGTSSAS